MFLKAFQRWINATLPSYHTLPASLFVIPGMCGLLKLLILLVNLITYFCIIFTAVCQERQSLRLFQADTATYTQREGAGCVISDKEDYLFFDNLLSIASFYFGDGGSCFWDVAAAPMARGKSLRGRAEETLRGLKSEPILIWVTLDLVQALRWKITLL